MKNACVNSVHHPRWVPALGLPLPIPEGGKEPLRGLGAGPVSHPMVLERGFGPLLTATHKFRRCLWRTEIPLHCLHWVSPVRVSTVLVRKIQSVMREVPSFPTGNGLNTTQSCLVPQVLLWKQQGLTYGRVMAFRPIIQTSGDILWVPYDVLLGSRCCFNGLRPTQIINLSSQRLLGV